MRKYLVIAFLFAFVGVFGQTNDTTKYFKSVDYGWQYKRLKVDSILIMPNGLVVNRSFHFLSASDTSAMLASYLRKLDTAAMLAPYYKASNPAGYITASAIANKVNYSDTASMLSPYAKTANLPSLTPYMKYSDSAAMLSAYYNKTATDAKVNLKVNISDTASMLSPYAKTANVISSATVVKYTDTASLLSGYYRSSNPNGYVTSSAISGKVNISDTASMLSPYAKTINIPSLTGVVKYTDTSSMLSGYQRSITNPITGSGTLGYLPKYTGANTLGTSMVYDDGSGHLGINTGSPNTLYNVDLNGTLKVESSFYSNSMYTGAHLVRDQMWITASTDGYTKSNTYNGASAYNMAFVGDMRFAGSTTAKAVFSFNGAYSNTGTGYNGDVSLMKLFTGDAFGNPNPTAGINGYGINIMPTLNYTQSTSNFTGIYYNPTLTATTGLTHYAMNLVSGSVKMGTLAGTGSRMVTADANGVLGTSAILDTTSLSNRINAKQNQLNGTGFVKASGTTISYDNSTYLTSYTETDPIVKAINGIVKSNGSIISAAIAGTDYVAPSALSSYLTTSSAASTYFPYTGGTLSGSLNANADILANTTLALKEGGTLTNWSGYTNIVGDVNGLKFKGGGGLNTSFNFSTTGFSFTGHGGYSANFIYGVSANRNYTLPYSSGTLALTSDITSAVSGTTNYISKFTGTNTLGNGLIYDNGSGVTVNSTTVTRVFNVYSATADNQVLIAGSAPSVSLADALSSGTYQAKFGLATASNNFVTNSVAGDFAISSQGTSSILWGVNGTEAMRIFGSTKNVAIGSSGTDAGYKLDVAGTGRFTSSVTANSHIYAVNGAISFGGGATAPSTDPAIYRVGSGVNDMAFATNSAERFRITNGGYINYTGIATSGSLAVAEIYNDNSLFAIYGTQGGGTTKDIEIWNGGSASAASLKFKSAGNLVYNGGKLLIGTTTDNGTGIIQANGNITTTAGVFAYGGYVSAIGTGSNSIGSGPYIAIVNSSNSYQMLQQLNYSYNLDFWSYRGGWTNVSRIDGSSGIYTPLSDSTKKKDFEVSTIGLKEVLQLKPTLFRMKTESQSVSKHLGFLAQDVKPIIPQAYVEEDGFIGLQDRPLIAALVKAIQELQQQINDLKNKQ